MRPSPRTNRPPFPSKRSTATRSSQPRLSDRESGLSARTIARQRARSWIARWSHARGKPSPPIQEMKGRWKHPISGMGWYRAAKRNLAALPEY
jgi:hypothetical protein